MTEFLSNSLNKTKLNGLIQKTAINPLFWSWPGEIVITHGKGIWRLSDGPEEFISWQDQLHEEADNRMIMHIRDMIINSHCESIIVRTVDSDVIIILVAFLSQFLALNEALQVYVDFGMGEHRRVVDINKVFLSIGEEMSKSILFLHAFSGCDSTASFYGKSKSSWYRKLQSYPGKEELLAVSEKISWNTDMIDAENSVKLIQQFVLFFLWTNSTISQ